MLIDTNPPALSPIVDLGDSIDHASTQHAGPLADTTAPQRRAASDHRRETLRGVDEHLCLPDTGLVVAALGAAACIAISNDDMDAAETLCEAVTALGVQARDSITDRPTSDLLLRALTCVGDTADRLRGHSWTVTDHEDHLHDEALADRLRTDLSWITWLGVDQAPESSDDSAQRTKARLVVAPAALSPTVVST